MPQRLSALRRRALLAGAAASLASPFASAQPGRIAGRPLTVLQVVDTSPAQQDVSKDFLIGSRAAWQAINARGGLRGRKVEHRSLEVDGSPASLRGVLATLRETPHCIALSGSAGDPVAAGLSRLLRDEDVAIAHAAPWLQSSDVDAGDRTFPIFATRREQIAHAVRSLALVGVQSVGAVFASAAGHRLYRDELERIAAELGLRLLAYRADGDLETVGTKLGPNAPAVLLFVGGTPELVQFTHGMQRQRSHRYLVALADVNLQTVQQMAGARTTGLPLIVTQPVPVVTAGLPVVRSYRDTLQRLFDEPPAALSLAGYIAARYTFEVLADVDGTPTRQSALAAFQRRATMDIGGFRVAFDERGRSTAYVTQSMLTQDGRVVG